MDTHIAAFQSLGPVAGTAPQGHLFQQDWWLEAASGGTVQRVEVVWDGLSVASLSFVERTRLGTMCSLILPPYTRTLGPVITLPEAKPAKHALNLQRVARELRALLPPHDRFQQQLDPEDPTALAFSLAGFAVSQNYTFRVGPWEDRGALLENVEPATRRLIRAGLRTLTAERHGDVGRFLALARRERPEEETTHDFPALERLAEACLARGQGCFLSAVDGEGRDLAAVFLVWDGRVAYYLVPVRDRAASGGGTNAFLLWSAMGLALDMGRLFDFDGYGTVGTARFMSGFGVPPVARPVVSWRSNRSRWVDLAKAAVRDGGGAMAQDLYSFPSQRNARSSRRERALREAPRD